MEAAQFGGAIEILRSVADRDNRPPPKLVLEAILEAQRKGGGLDKSPFLDALAGVSGRRWELAYIAGQPAVKEARQRKGGDSWYRSLERVLLPWTKLRDGLYVDSFVSAVQNFDAETMQNKNGVFQILGSDIFETTVNGPFLWSDRGGVCAFRPNFATFKLGPFKFDQNIPEDIPFKDTPIKDLPFFKFILVDDKVAVAMGRSGSVALWTRMVE